MRGCGGARYSGKILGCKVFGWKRVRDIEITRAQEGDEPPVLMRMVNMLVACLSRS